MTTTAVFNECIAMKEKANDDNSYTLRCVSCQNKVFYYEYDKALVPGHIYSAAGRDEYGITRLCEFCFDGITLPDEETDEGQDYDCI